MLSTPNQLQTSNFFSSQKWVEGSDTSEGRNVSALFKPSVFKLKLISCILLHQNNNKWLALYTINRIYSNICALSNCTCYSKSVCLCKYNWFCPPTHFLYPPLSSLLSNHKIHAHSPGLPQLPSPPSCEKGLSTLLWTWLLPCVPQIFNCTIPSPNPCFPSFSPSLTPSYLHTPTLHAFLPFPSLHPPPTHPSFYQSTHPAKNGLTISPILRASPQGTCCGVESNGCECWGEKKVKPH